MTGLRSIALLTCIAMTTAACSTFRITNSDQICAELSTFVAASSSDQENAIVLRGGWGGDTEGTLATHDCHVIGNHAGQRFCDYLVPNTSWEFGGNNLNRLSACFDDQAAAKALRRAADSGELSVMSTAVSVSGGGSANLVVNYNPPNMSNGLYTLSIAVSRSGYP